MQENLNIQTKYTKKSVFYSLQLSIISFAYLFTCLLVSEIWVDCLDRSFAILYDITYMIGKR